MPDRLSALPDELLHHILGFLPAHEAVRTSVLARRWRPLWKSVRRLHITTYPVEDEDGDDYGRRTSHFANSLFLMRGSASLDEVKFSYDLPWKKTVMWLRHALLCEAQSVIVHVDTVPGLKWVVQDPPLVSRYLRKLELHQLYLMDIFLDFASCPALEALEISQCDIESEKIISPSVKLLCMDTIYFVNICQTRISVPSLISFQLNKFKGTSPLLESMPLLETALVKPSFGTNDVRPDYIWKSCGSCSICCAEDDFKGRCLLLGGLSHAVNLELTAYPEGTCVFRRDLRWCPTFSRLKTLVLYDFYVASELFTILNHSPILENLTLYLCKGPEHPSETLANNTLMDTPAALSRRLKTIKIRCQDFDHMVYDLLKVLTAWGIDVTIKRLD